MCVKIQIQRYTMDSNIITYAPIVRKGALYLTDKEFKRLTRPQLIDVIYQLQMQVDTLTEQKDQLEKALEDRRLRIENAGNIATAALEINDCFRSAQSAAEQYLNEIKEMHAETEKQCKRLVEDAEAEAASIIMAAKRALGEYDSVIEDICKEYEQD